MRKKVSPHWFLDRWCAEFVVEGCRHPKEAARHLGVPYAYVIAAVKRVHGCSVSAARHHLHKRPES